MGNLGWPEILIILVIALIIFGPRKLPELGKSLGNSLAQFRRASEDFKRTWEEEVEVEKHRLEAPPPAAVEPERDVGASTLDEDQPEGHSAANPFDTGQASQAPEAEESPATIHRTDPDQESGFTMQDSGFSRGS